jgi:hypothetical protein
VFDAADLRELLNREFALQVSAAESSELFAALP